MVNNFVLIRAYNSGGFIADTLDSTFSLSIPNLKIIIVNDGSTDNTQKIISSFQKKYPAQIYTRYQKNKGTAGALKKLVETAAKIVSDMDNVFVLDSDDTFSKGILTACEKLNEADVCYLPYQMIGSSKYHSRSPDVHNNFAAFLSHQVISIESFSPILKSTFAHQVGIGYPLKAIKGHILKKYAKHVLSHFPMDTNVAEDIPSLLFPLFKGARVTGVEVPVYNYFRHENSITGQVDRKNFISNLKFLYLISQLVETNSQAFIPSAGLVVRAFVENRMKPYLQQKIQMDQSQIPGYAYSLKQFESDWKKVFLAVPVCRFNIKRLLICNQKLLQEQASRINYSHS